MTQKYRLTKNGRYCGEVTLHQARLLLCEGSTAVLDAVKNGTEIDGYTIEKAQTAENENVKRAVLKKYGWEELRFRLNPGAKK